MTMGPDISTPPNCGGPQNLKKSLAAGSCVYWLSNIPVLLGMCLGYFAVRPGRDVPYGENSLLLRFAAWDGGQFMTILDHGYAFDPDKISNVALFPGYPVVAASLQRVTGISSAAALLVIAHLSLWALFVVWHRYLCVRFPKQPQIALYGLLILACFPTTFFLRMAYSESLFLLLAVLVLLGVVPSLADCPGIAAGWCSSLCTSGRCGAHPGGRRHNFFAAVPPGNKIQDTGRLPATVLLGSFGLYDFSLEQIRRSLRVQSGTGQFLPSTSSLVHPTLVQTGNAGTGLGATTRLTVPRTGDATTPNCLRC